MNLYGLGINSKRLKRQFEILEYMINESSDNELGFSATELSRKKGYHKQSLIQDLDTWHKEWLVNKKEKKPKNRTDDELKQEPRKYYTITNVGKYACFRNMIKDKEITEDRLRELLENFAQEYEHISKHWNDELVDWYDLRVKCLYQTVSLINYEIWDENVLGFKPISLRMRMVHNLSRFNFTFEKSYVHYSEEKLETEQNQDIIRQVIKDDPFEYEDSQAKGIDSSMEEQINVDLPRFITYLFYYLMFSELDYLYKQLDRFKKPKHNKKLSKAMQLRGIKSLVRQFGLTTGIDFGKNPNKFEDELIKIASVFYNNLVKVIKEDKELYKVIRSVQNDIKDESKRIPEGIKEIVH